MIVACHCGQSQKHCPTQNNTHNPFRRKPESRKARRAESHVLARGYLYQNTTVIPRAGYPFPLPCWERCGDGKTSVMCRFEQREAAGLINGVARYKGGGEAPSQQHLPPSMLGKGVREIGLDLKNLMKNSHFLLDGIASDSYNGVGCVEGRGNRRGMMLFGRGISWRK